MKSLPKEVKVPRCVSPEQNYLLYHKLVQKISPGSPGGGVTPPSPPPPGCRRKLIAGMAVVALILSLGYAFWGGKEPHVTVPLAVYTSRDGSGWDEKAKLPKSQWETFEETFKQKHGEFPPDTDALVKPKQGIYEIDDDAFIYRYWSVKQDDESCRAPLYFVLGVLPKAELLRLDIEKLLASDAFTQEMKSVPNEVKVPECASPEQNEAFYRELVKKAKASEPPRTSLSVITRLLIAVLLFGLGYVFGRAKTS